MRQYLASMWALLLIWSAGFPFGIGAAPEFYGLMIVTLGLASLVLWPNHHRRKARLKHLVPQPGELLVPGVLVGQEVPGVRVEARSALRWTVPGFGSPSWRNAGCGGGSPSGWASPTGSSGDSR